jgi:hypothetical protein
MYGTIMRGTLRPEDRDAFLAAISDEEQIAVPGFRSSYLMFPEGRDDEVVLAVFFDDRESYMKNADDPAQNERYMTFRKYLTDDPTWTDGDWHAFIPD